VSRRRLTLVALLAILLLMSAGWLFIFTPSSRLILVPLVLLVISATAFAYILGWHKKDAVKRLSAIAAGIVALLLGLLAIPQLADRTDATPPVGGLPSSNSTSATSTETSGSSSSTQRQAFSSTTTTRAESNPSPSVTQLSVNKVRLPAGGCGGGTYGISLFDLAVDAGKMFGVPTQYSDLQYKICAHETNPVLQGVNGALTSKPSTVADIDFQGCQEAVGSSLAKSLSSLRKDTTFCVKQGDASVEHFGGRVVAKITIDAIETDQSLQLEITRWVLG
jgi:hypothetical protein